MTSEGIIQKVFTKWKNYSNTIQCRQDIVNIEQELIAEIKKQYPNPVYTERVWLIGDTQE